MLMQHKVRQVMKLKFRNNEERGLMGIGMPELITARFIGVPKEINEVDHTVTFKVVSEMEGEQLFKDYKLADECINLRGKAWDDAHANWYPKSDD